MKKILFVLMSAILFSGCSVDSVESEQLITADAKPSISAEEDAAPEMFDFEGVVCQGVASDYCFTFPQATAGPNNKDTNVMLQIYVYGDDPNSDEDDYWEQVFKGEGGTEVCSDWTFDEVGTYEIRYKIGSGGFTEDVIVVEDCSSCINELNAELTCGEVRSLNLTFTAEEAGPIVIQGGLTRGAEINSAQSNVLTQNLGHPSVVNSNSSVTRWEGDIEACEEVTIAIEFTGGNGIGDWSAKRGEIELGYTAEQSCE